MQKIEMENKVQSIMSILHRMMDRFTSKAILKRAKLNLLNNQWEQTLENLQERADKSKY